MSPPQSSHGSTFPPSQLCKSASPGRRSHLVENRGIIDTQDCQDAPKLLGADPYSLIGGSRAAIRGGSAGSFTALASISIAPDPWFFKAATLSPVISDLVSFIKFTYKFDLRYMDKLLCGTLQQVPEVYAAHSLSAADLADKIVAPLMVRGLLSFLQSDALLVAGASRGRRQGRASRAG
jgi:dipeptidyl aminopeptidase/acylaminoacyl peptidase